MKPNPGGQLAPENIVGRDELVTRMWDVLDGRSIYMNDVRRVGKTQILIKMQGSAPAGWRVIKQDLGGMHSTAEFATWVFRESHKVLSGKKRAFRKMEGLLGRLKGLEVVGVLKLPSGAVAPWKEVLIRTFSDLEEELASQDERLVFLWDRQARGRRRCNASAGHPPFVEPEPPKNPLRAHRLRGSSPRVEYSQSRGVYRIALESHGTYRAWTVGEKRR
jgi:hypothetical protein